MKTDEEINEQEIRKEERERLLKEIKTIPHYIFSTKNHISEMKKSKRGAWILVTDVEIALKTKKEI